MMPVQIIWDYPEHMRGIVLTHCSYKIHIYESFSNPDNFWLKPDFIFFKFSFWHTTTFCLLHANHKYNLEVTACESNNSLISALSCFYYIRVIEHVHCSWILPCICSYCLDHGWNIIKNRKSFICFQSSHRAQPTDRS